MNDALRALGVGFAAETVMVAAALVGGFGPEGPGSTVGAYILFIHTPGFSLADSIGIRGSESYLLVLVAYVSLWSCIAYFLLSRRPRRGS